MLVNNLVQNSNNFLKNISKNCCKKFIRKKVYRNILGIETSCDDTGAAIINENGELLAEQLNSQTAYHLE